LQLFSATLRGWVHPSDAFILLHEQHENAFWLDRENHPSQAFSVIGASSAVLSGPDLADLKDQFNSRIQESIIQGHDTDLPFDWRPGFVGVVEYEGAYRFLDVDRAMVFDHKNRHMHFIGLFDSEAEFKQWHHAGLLRLGLAGGQVAHYLHKNQRTRVESRASLRHQPGEYLQLISRAQKSIAAGDVYQICLTNQIRIQTEVDPLVTFIELRKSHSTPYAAFLQIGKTSIASISPEQFLKVSSDRKLSSKPIKGTRPRHPDFAKDDEIARELATNSKERAENLMIVDLMRNDFSQVSEPDSVTVTKLFDIESYSTVHQLVSTIESRLNSEATAIDAFSACFPGGSMTGAPKPRAIELIQEFELGPRGIYSGAIGYFGADGSAEFGMVIRTLVFEQTESGQAVTLGVGGGITIDSDPKAELQETELKAQALLAALGVASPWG
jgi:aminodeoxychorismate synthase component I